MSGATVGLVVSLGRNRRTSAVTGDPAARVLRRDASLLAQHQNQSLADNLSPGVSPIRKEKVHDLARFLIYLSGLFRPLRFPGSDGIADDFIYRLGEGLELHGCANVPRNRNCPESLSATESSVACTKGSPPVSALVKGFLGFCVAFICQNLPIRDCKPES